MFERNGTAKPLNLNNRRLLHLGTPFPISEKNKGSELFILLLNSPRLLGRDFVEQFQQRAADFGFGVDRQVA